MFKEKKMFKNSSRRDLSNGYFQNIDTKDIISKYTNFNNSDITGSTFNNVDMTGSNFTNATLKGCTFIDVELVACDFSNANLTGAKFVSCNLDSSIFHGSIFNGVDFGFSKINSQTKFPNDKVDLRGQAIETIMRRLFQAIIIPYTFFCVIMYLFFYSLWEFLESITEKDDM